MESVSYSTEKHLVTCSALRLQGVNGKQGEWELKGFAGATRLKYWELVKYSWCDHASRLQRERRCGCANRAAALKGMAVKGRQHLWLKSGGCRHATRRRTEKEALKVLLPKDKLHD